MRPGFKSVVIRAVLSAAVLTLVFGASGGGNPVVLFAFGFVFLLAFGYLFDRWFYKLRLRRWERKQAGTA